MALKRPDIFFGIHSFAAINRTTKVPYGSSTKGNGIIKVLKSASVNVNQQLVELTGGSFSGPVAAERGASNIEVALRFAEYPAWLFELGGWIHTATSAETSGNASASFGNTFGTSVKDSSTGIASASITTAADLKNLVLYIVAASSTTVNVYAINDADFKGNGTSLSFQDADRKSTRLNSSHT